MSLNITVPWISPHISELLRNVFLKHGRESVIKRGHVLVSESEGCGKVIYLKSGLLSRSIMEYERNKSAVTCGIVFPGTTCGSTSYISGQFAPVRIVAEKTSEIKTLDFAELNTILEKYPALRDEFDAHCFLCLKAVADAMLVIATMPAADRIKVFIAAAIHWFGLDISQEYILMPVKLSRKFIKEATYVSHITLDRIFGEWAREGVIRKNKSGHNVRISDFMWAYNWIANRSFPGYAPYYKNG